MPRAPLLTRRRVLQGLGVTVVGAGIDAFGVEPRWLDVARHEVAIPKLPLALEGPAR